jgi:hypothetical protein
MGCGTCHNKVGGNYPLRDKGLETFKKSGGVLL